MDSNSQNNDSTAVPSTEPAKMYDPAEVKVWPSSPLLPEISSMRAEHEPDITCPSFQTLPDCFDDTDMRDEEMQSALADLDAYSPSEDLFMRQDDLELPEIPPPISEHGEKSMDTSPDGNEDQDPSGEWPEVEEAPENFEDAEKWFQGLQQPTLADMVQYEAAKLKEGARQKRAENQKAAEENPLIVDEDDSDANKSEHNEPLAEQNATQSASKTGKRKPSARRKRNPGELSAAEKKKSMQFGLDAVLGKVKKGKGGRKGQKRTTGKSDPPAPKRKPKKASKQTGESLESLLNTNFVQDANISSSMDAIPRVTKNDKEKALAELVAGLPSADQKEAKSDKRECIMASRKFSQKVKMEPKNNGWKLVGMQTTLYHYQLLGASFMRGREHCTRQPFGGMLCDTMGFGKTIQALANVIDGKHSNETDSVNSTLIVVPSHLVEHWRNQILKHCDRNAAGEVIIYRANSRLDTLDSPRSLQNYDIVITTYDEVRRSYPPNKGKPDGNDEDKIREWWTENYEKNAGPLHRIRFRRIILDEGHLIKNHTSQTSIAVRALTGHFKWVLSGTPVQNYIHEFYPLFDFLGVPNTGTFTSFIEQYCMDDTGRDRLLNLLRSFMFRRTHASRLFSLPVVNLPDIKERTISTEFCAAERAIYDAIVDAFINNINGISAVLENPKMAQHQCILAMMQKLRMVCSHVLTVQKMLKDLLSGTLMKTLTNIAQNCGDPEDPSITITTWIRALAKNPFPPQSKKPSEPEESVVDEPQEINPELVQEFHQLMTKLHQEEQWDERLARTNCPCCKLAPVSPIITSCMHLYCEECYYLLGDKESESSSPQRQCVECNVVIEKTTPGVPVEDIDLEKPSSDSTAQKKNTSAKKKAKSRSTRRYGGAFGYPGPRPDDNAALDDEDEEPDWISACGGAMPSAKLTKVRELIANWIAENPNVKVVVFTQFMDFVRILGIMCSKQGWSHAELTGKMPPKDRFKSVEKFKEQEEMRVLIVSLKAGGTGLDMPMASKCILVDLWWNEAVQDQAVARIYRIGQKNNVEFVKIIVKDTIDDYLLDLQKWKTSDISTTIGIEPLGERASVVDLLRIFATVVETESGTIRITGRKDVKGKQAVH